MDASGLNAPDKFPYMPLHLNSNLIFFLRHVNNPATRFCYNARIVGDLTGLHMELTENVFIRSLGGNGVFKTCQVWNLKGTFPHDAI